MKKLTRALCLVTLLVAITEFASAITVSETHSNVTCNAGSNGSIDVSVSGGTAPYTFSWSGGATTEDRSGLAAGLYSVTVTDFVGTTSSLSVIITQPSAIITSASVTNVSCGGGNTGAINLSVIGGTPGYSYAWNDFVYTEDRTNLSAAVYYCTVTDLNGCVKVDSVNVTQPAGMVLSRTVTNVTCGSGANGGINLTVQFGTGPYSYLWSDGAVTEDRSAIAAGTYSVTVTDAGGCTASISATITQSGGGMAINTSSIQPACFGGSTGSITVINVVGSVGPYTFKWSDGPTTQNRTGVSSGSYVVTATSTTGCTASASVNLGQPTAINITLVPIPIPCYAGNNGAINTTVTGGSSPYSYNWGGGVITQNRTGLVAGTYTVTVTDSKGCTKVASTVITQPVQLTSTAVPSPLACTGGPTGSVITSVAGGVGPYSYNWGGGIVTQDRINVNAGNYSVTVTDANGCTSMASSTVPAYTPMNTSATQVNNVCFGGSTGSINLSVSNGKAPYSFLWSNGSTSEDISLLTAGAYTVTVTDSNACTTTRVVNITQPGLGMNISATVNDVSCFGLSDGSITVSTSNGNAPYSYNWGGGITTATRTGLSVGNYTVSVTDNIGCTSTSAAITVAQPAAISVSTSVINATCFGVANGSVSLSTTGGFSPYTYFWSNGSSNSSIAVAGGTYTVTVSDNHSCTAIANATVGQNSQIAISSSISNVNCAGGSNGGINVTVSGGVSPYAYNWGGGIATEDRSTLSAGNYAVTVTDNAGCTSNSAFVVNDGASVSASSVVTNVTCNSGNNGAINLTAAGVNSPFTYNWGGGVTTEDRTGLAAGIYTVTISDNSGCTAVHSASVNQATSLNVTAAVVNATCFGAANGSINVTVTGGSAPYSYNWGGGVATEDRSALSANTYTVTVTDNLLCTASVASVVTQPSAVTITSVITNVACAGGNNGAIDITANGGTGVYSYNWGSGIITEDRSGLSANTYSVTVTDANTCTGTHTANVIQNANLTISSVVTTPTCFGANNGSITLTTNGGTSPYHFNWGGGVITQNRTALVAGAYAVTVTDNFGCSGTHSVALTQPTVVSGSVIVTNVSCNGGTNGAINLTATGGSTPYSYNWGGGVVTEDRSGLTSGFYTVTVSDVNSCSATVSANIVQPAILSASISLTDAFCNGQNSGAAALSVSGGTLPYSFGWSNASTSQNLNSIAAGSYSVTVTDINSCTATTSAIISEPSPISSFVTTNNPTCFGAATGSVDLTVSGGIGGYTYLWSNASTTQDLFNVIAGNYAVTVRDANNCSATSSYVLTQPASISLNPTQVNISCSASNIGSISLNPTGGSSPFIYTWSNGSNSAAISNLSSGNYSVTVYDNNSCSTSHTYTITQSTAPVITLTKTDITCNGLTNGTISTALSGGASPFTFLWNNGAVSQNRTGLAVGVHAVTVTGSNTCTASASIAIAQPSAVALTTTKVNVLCNGANTGSVDLTVSGGTSPYNYSWSNGWGIQDLSGVPAGNYTVTVNDVNNCSATTSAAVTQPTAITIGVSLSNVSCNGGNNGSISTTISGGNGGYSYLWSNGATAQNLINGPAGVYTLSVTDAQNCLASLTMNITQPAGISLSSVNTNVQCSGGTGGSVDLSVSGGSPLYNYLWSNGATTQDMSNLQSGTYSVTVTDANSCSATLAAVVTAPTQMVLAAAATNVTCNGASTGSVSLTVTGGLSPLTYNWSNNATTQNISNVISGNYTVTVTDGSSCNATASATISQPSAIQVVSSVTDVTCFGSSNGSVQLTVTGGTPFAGNVYQYNWNTGETTSTLSNKTAGSYTVTVVDASSCQATASVAIGTPFAMQIAETHTNADCNGNSSGAINISVTGGNGGFNHVWSNGATSEDIASLVAGNYTVTVTDVNACSAQRSITITEPATLTLSEVHTDYACASSTGSVNLSVAGGTSPYSFVWSNSAVTEDLTNLTAGTYDVVVTDINGCNQTLSATVQAIQAMSTTVSNTNLTCFGATGANIDLSVSGGSAPYSFVWSNSATTEDLNGLSAGVYDVLVTDLNNCVTTNSATVSQPASITVTPVKNDISCFGGSNGSVQVNVVGGTSPYNYVWNNSSTTQSISSLSAGSFYVTVTDANSCTQAASVTIVEPAVLSASSSVLSVGCSGINDGAIDVTVSGGVAPYQFTWNNNRNTEDILNLAAGNYSVTVTDANGCTTQKDDVVGLTPPIVIASTISNTPCTQVEKGAIDITVTGGTPTYTFDWSNGATSEDISNLAMGGYSVIVTDIRNCTSQSTFNVAFDYALTVQTVSDINIDLGAVANLAAITNVNHNNSYQWSPAYNVTCASCSVTEASPTTNTVYTVNVTDENGCTASGETNVTVNSITDIFIPNAFSPNNDGNNDFLQLYGDVNTIQYMDFKVFNRWGEMVFSSSNHQFQWDGTYKGELVDRGAYIYTMNVVFINGYSRDDYKGSITILR
jgi:gliding motility-associated-like protein